MVGHEKSLFSGILIGPKSLFRFTLIACNFEIYAAHRRSLLQRAAPEDAVRSAVHVESSDIMCSRKGQCQTPPEYPETGDTYHSREGICAGEKSEQQNVYKRHSSAPLTTTTATTHTTSSSIIIGWNLYEYVG